jgi:hypothetical protein
LGPVDTRPGNPARGTCGHAWGAGGIDRTGAGRVLAGAAGSEGAAAAAVRPIRGAAFDDGAVDVLAAGDAGVAARSVAPVCCPCVAVRGGWVGAVGLATGALAVVPGAGVFVTTRVIRATVGVTVRRVVVTRPVGGVLGRRWVADAVAVVTTLVTGVVACANAVVVAVAVAVTVLTVLVAVAAGAVAVAVAVLTVLVAVLTVLVAVLTVLAMGAAGAVVAAGLVVVAGAVAAALTGLVAALTVFVMGAVGAVGAAGLVAGTGAAGAAGGVVTTFETAPAGEPGFATADVAELRVEVVEASCVAGLGVAATARFGSAATIASSEIAAADHRNRLPRSPTSVGRLPRSDKT